MRQPVSVLVYAARRDLGGWSYLLLWRVPRPEIAVESFWQGVTGALEDDETPSQAAERELAEETGFVNVPVMDIGLTYAYPIQDSWRHLYPAGATEIVEHVFVAIVPTDASPKLSHEHETACWCRLGDAPKLLKFHENVLALQRVDAYLQAMLGIGGAGPLA